MSGSKYSPRVSQLCKPYKSSHGTRECGALGAESGVLIHANVGGAVAKEEGIGGSARRDDREPELRYPGATK